MYKKIATNLLMLVFLILSHVVYAEKTPISELKLFLASTSSLMATFKQVTLSENNQPTKTSQGKFYLSRPGRFRWSYKKPFEQEIVSNVGKVWFYDVGLEQVTVKKMDESLGSTPALLLSGDIALEENFIIQQQGIDEDLQWIKLIPKNEDSGFNYILIGLNDNVLGGMELSDNFGQLTRIYFSDVKINPSIDDKIFKFVAPEGVDVFEN